MLRFDRIEHLLSPEDLRDKRVVQVGVGSGGAVVNDHLTMNGVRRWMLFDPDRYEDVNLVKHPRLRADLGELKVENQKKWILDRNPDADVEAVPEDVMQSARFRDAVRDADLVLCCADKQEARLFVNAVAAEMQRPCVTASVFRRGFGGEAYAYIPSVSGCFDCMLRVAAAQGWNMEGPVELLPVEKDAIYGLNLKDFRASGLSMDIQAIAIIQARLALDILLAGAERRFARPPANWVIFYNRRVPGVPDSGFLKSKNFKVKPQRDCSCAKHEVAQT
jgi:molybdopterin/thiamine biosynthesis adenylyltransferase